MSIRELKFSTEEKSTQISIFSFVFVESKAEGLFIPLGDRTEAVAILPSTTSHYIHPS